jgi:hypothetical protein
MGIERRVVNVFGFVIWASLLRARIGSVEALRSSQGNVLAALTSKKEQLCHGWPDAESEEG